jgi:hypothetical protein
MPSSCSSPTTSIKAWEQGFVHVNVCQEGSNLSTLDHQLWKNIFQRPHCVLVPNLKASTAIGTRKREVRSAHIIYEDKVSILYNDQHYNYETI